jgi:hypothetical protein
VRLTIVGLGGLLLLLAGRSARAQDVNPVPIDSAVLAKVLPDSGNMRFTPLFAPAYNPEMQFLILGGFLLSWKADRNIIKLQRSTLTSTISFSTTGAINLNMSLATYLRADRLRVAADVSMKNMPDNYWGVGYEAGLEPSGGDSTTAYNREWVKVNPRIVWRVSRHLLVGPLVEITSTLATDVNATMAADPNVLRDGTETGERGLGIVVQHDSRDVVASPWSGRFTSITFTAYGQLLASDHTYQTLLLEHRQYHTLGRVGRTLAWQIKSRIATHQVPWSELSLLGTGSDLRGYVEGRFRDRMTLLGVMEYRHMFLRGDGRLSRHGFVTWVGAGTLGNDPAHLQGIVPSAGVGYRFELQPRSNVRMDFGIGRRSHGIYFNFTEAF